MERLKRARQDEDLIKHFFQAFRTMRKPNIPENPKKQISAKSVYNNKIASNENSTTSISQDDTIKLGWLRMSFKKMTD